METDAAGGRDPAQRPGGLNLFTGIASIISSAAVWWATGPFGFGLSPDGVAYVAIAESLRDRGEFSYWLEPNTSSWPPLFPALIAGLAKAVGLSALDASRILETLTHGATVVVVALLARRMLQSRTAQVGVVLVAALAQPLLKASLVVASEPLFCLLVLLIALAISSSATTTGSGRLLAVAALAVAAFATRYAGVAFIAASAFTLLGWPRSIPLKTRARRSATFAAPALIGVALIGEWNRRRSGDPFGPRVRPDDPFWLHAGDAVSAIGKWFLPGMIDGGVAAALGSVAVAAGLVPAARAITRHRTAIARPAESAETSTAVLTLSVSVPCYIGYMVIARTFAGFERLDGRLLLPILFPLSLLLAVAAELALRSVSEHLSRMVAVPIVGLLVVPTAMDGLNEIANVRDAGTPYTNQAVRDALAGSVVTSIPNDCTLVSNDAWLLWLAGREAQFPPLARHDDRFARPMTRRDLDGYIERTSVCVLWFDTGSTLFTTPDELRSTAQVTTLASDALATLYRVTPKRP